MKRVLRDVDLRVKPGNLLFAATIAAVSAALLPATALASSHREAPFISTQPQVDGTDLYMFRSYQPGRSG